MAVPDYQSLMLPLMRFAADEKDHKLQDAYATLAAKFKLTDDERNELLPSGRQSKFDNRVGWARTYLKKAGLLESPARSTFRITKRGMDVLKANPPFINASFLKQFPEFVAFQRATHESDDGKEIEVSGETPEEVFEASYKKLRAALAEDLLERIKGSSPKFFENLVVMLLVEMGYGGSLEEAGQSVGRSGDEGIDGIIKEDKLGLDVIYVQAKRWSGNVGQPTVREFAGSLEGQRAKKGVLITTSQFSKDARDFVSRIEKKIVLIDGPMLADLMIDHDVGVSVISSYQIKKVDTDYFADES